MCRVGSYERVLEAPHGKPILQKDLAIVAATEHAGRTTVLLCSIDAIGEQVVGRDVVELPRRLVVPGTPGFAGVHSDDRSLIHTENHARRIVGVDPRHVEIVAAGGSSESFERLATVGGAIHRGLRYVEQVGIPGVDEDATEIFVASHPRVLGGLLPSLAAVIRAEEPLLQDCVHAASTGCRSDRDANPAASLFRQTGTGKRSPGRTTISGLHDV